MEKEVLNAVREADSALIVRLSRPGPRYTSFPTAPVWNSSVGPEEFSRYLELSDAEGDQSPLSIYVHIPFCQAMCTYCGCNVVVARRKERADLYLDYVEREIDLVVRHLPRRRKVSQLHWGGGTPTFLTVEQLRRLDQIITSRFELLPEAEKALEVDPVVTSVEQLELLRELGFNRLSMGIQDFTPEVQQYVGRLQSEELTLDLYRAARRLGFSGINVDLIYGLPKQKLETFTATLQRVQEMAPDRIAVFSYAHVPWMKPHQRKFDEALIPDAVDKFRLFRAALEILLEAGYFQIGMDHFSRPEDELARARVGRRLHRNFQGYTIKPASDMLAFGVTGISDVKGCYAQSLKPLGRYYKTLQAGHLPTEKGWICSKDDQLRRRLIHSLMCNYYVDLEPICHDAGVEPEDYFSEELKELQSVEGDGLLIRTGGALELTPLGRILMRNVAMIFDPYLKRPTPGENPRHPIFSKTI